MCQFLINPENAVCFSGPRPANLPDQGNAASPQIRQMLERLEQSVLSQYENGKRVFLNGLMSGFDVMAGETVLRLKRQSSGIRCVSVRPFADGYFDNANWNCAWKQRAARLEQESDEAIVLKSRYEKGVYYLRDRFLVDHASALVCYYTGTSRGTKYTYDYAKKRGVQIVNLAPAQRGDTNDARLRLLS